MTTIFESVILWHLNFKGFMMSKRNIYAVLTVLGLLLPYSLFFPWLMEYGLDFTLFFNELFVNDVAGTGGLDILAVTFVILVFIVFEGRKVKMKNLYIPIIATFIAVGFGLALFLCMRERHYEKVLKNE